MDHSNNIKLLLPGLAGASITHGLGHPLYTIKTRLQVGIYNKFTECVKGSTKNEGIMSFYRGYPALIASVVIVRPIEMAIFEIMVKQTKSAYISGFVASGVAGTLGCPLSVIRTVMQSSNYKQHKNIIYGIKHIWNNYGFKGFFAGYPVQMAYYLSLGTFYLGTYGVIRSYVLQGEYNLFKYSAFSVLMSSIMKLTLYPIDTVKSIAQYKNIPVSEAFKIVKNNKGFYRGAYPILLYLIPVNSFAIMVYETTKKYLSV